MEKPIMVVGCGTRGLEWAKTQPGKVICLDNDPRLAGRPDVAAANGLYLPFPPDSASVIHADFFLNAVAVPGITMADIYADPRILTSDPFPPEFGSWFRDRMRGNATAVRANLEPVRWLLRQHAVGEMLRVVEPDGKIIVVDHRHVAAWLAENAPKLAAGSSYELDMHEEEITDDDMRRSASLALVTGKGEPVNKLVLTKHESGYPLPFGYASRRQLMDY